MRTHQRAPLSSPLTFHQKGPLTPQGSRPAAPSKDVGHLVPPSLPPSSGIARASLGRLLGRRPGRGHLRSVPPLSPTPRDPSGRRRARARTGPSRRSVSPGPGGRRGAAKRPLVRRRGASCRRGVEPHPWPGGGGGEGLEATPASTRTSSRPRRRFDGAAWEQRATPPARQSHACPDLPRRPKPDSAGVARSPEVVRGEARSSQTCCWGAGSSVMGQKHGINI